MSNSPYGSYGAPLPGYGTSLVDRINLYLHFRRYFRILADRWLLLCSFTAVGAVVGGWIAWVTPNRFEAYSVLAMAPKLRGPGMGPEIADEGQKLAETHVQLMQSGFLHQKVIAKVAESSGLSNKFGRPRFDAYAGKGNTFNMKVISTNYQYAEKCARAWGEEFIELKKQHKANLLGTTEAATQRELMTYNQRYEQAQAATADFRKRYGITTDSDAGVALQTRLEKAKGDYNAIKMERELFENTRPEQLAAGAGPAANVFRANVIGETPTATKTPAGASRQDDLAASDKFAAWGQYSEIKMAMRMKEKDYNDRTNSLKAAHPFMQNLRRDIAVLDEQLKGVLGQVDEMRKTHIAALKVREQSYPGIISKLEEEVLQSSQIQGEYRHLRETEAFIKEQLDQVRRQQQTFARAGVDEDDFIAYELGVGNEQPTGPNRPMIVGTGILLGLLAGLGAMYLLHRLDDRVDQPERIEELLEEPVMGQLPEVDKKHYKEGYLLLSRMKAHTMFAEALRGVRSALLLSPEGGSKRMLAVTSAVPGDGKTTFTTNFAVTLANAGNKTLLIDADLRRGNIHGYFEQPMDGGLTEVLQGKMGFREAVRETSIPNLFFMRAGERPSNPSELLLGGETKALIRALRQEFDYVIFDCPPLTAIDDTFSIAAYLDGLFFVVRAGKTSMRFAKLAVNTIRQRGAPILGLVVNGVPIDNPYYYYTTYYYASYYHRPDDGELPSAESAEGASGGRASASAGTGASGGGAGATSGRASGSADVVRSTGRAAAAAADAAAGRRAGVAAGSAEAKPSSPADASE